MAHAGFLAGGGALLHFAILIVFGVFVIDRLGQNAPVSERNLVQEGRISGVSSVSKFGSNEDIDTGSTPEDIWQQGDVWVADTTAQTHDVVSTSAADDAVGTGARTVRLYGLDANWDAVSEVITLDGTTAVTTALSYIRVYRMVVLTFGSGGTNDGDITTTSTTSGNLGVQVTAGTGQTQHGIYSIPRGCMGYLGEWSVSLVRATTPSGAMAQVDLLVRTGADAADAGFVIKDVGAVSATGQTTMHHEFHYPLVVPEKSDIKLQVTSVTDDDSIVNGRFQIRLVC